LGSSSAIAVFGGEKARTGEFPHMVAIGWRKHITITFDCGGSLISNRFVLTAAHCEKSDSIRPSFVRLGDQNLKTRSDGVVEVDIDIAEFIKHEQYSALTHKNDVALIKMAREVT
jgi:secreted trypsin-like serine protease